ncbi:diphthine synthase [Tremella mesenterica]|uniref:diphthine methyl ester synthase n=1 Tax=Tremella mesenterica TaxID=5217 RepID=A0A4Q1BBI6_TREME|nr:diphthine synthase [Tremella mesenterica]
MLYIVGLGLSDERDITVKGLDAVKKSARVYLESYTSILMCPIETLEAFYERKVITATREMVELQADEILQGADKLDVAFLVVGDPLGATTHSDLILRARSLNIPTQVIHNASILTALGSTGLQMYSFGQTISLPFYTSTWAPDSWYDRLEENLRVGLHTLVLLDIKVREQSEENMARGRLIYEPPRFMSPHTAFQQILQTLSTRHARRAPPSDSLSSDGTTPASHPNAYLDNPHTNGSSRQSSPLPADGQPFAPAPSTPIEEVSPLCVPDRTLALSLSRVGTPTQRIIAGTLAELAGLPEEDSGPPLHSLVIVGKRLHPLELEYAGQFCVGGRNGQWWTVGQQAYGVARETDT